MVSTYLLKEGRKEGRTIYDLGGDVKGIVFVFFTVCQGNKVSKATAT